MKNLKKLMALGLAIVMVCAMAVSASAASNITETIGSTREDPRMTVKQDDTIDLTNDAEGMLNMDETKEMGKSDATSGKFANIKNETNDLTTITVEEAGSDADKSNSDKPTPVVLEAEGLFFSVTVPTVLPVYVDDKNIAHEADGVKIINNGYGPVKVKAVNVTATQSWKLVDGATTDEAMDAKSVNTKEYAMTIDGNAVAADGTVTLGTNLSSQIKAVSDTDNGNVITFPYTIKTAPQATAIDAETSVDSHIGNVVFTLGWDFAA